MWDPSLFAQKKVVTTEGTAACSFERTAVLQDYIKRVCCSQKGCLLDVPPSFDGGLGASKFALDVRPEDDYGLPHVTPRSFK